MFTFFVPHQPVTLSSEDRDTAQQTLTSPQRSGFLRGGRLLPKKVNFFLHVAIISTLYIYSIKLRWHYAAVRFFGYRRLLLVDMMAALEDIFFPPCGEKQSQIWICWIPHACIAIFSCSSSIPANPYCVKVL